MKGTEGRVPSRGTKLLFGLYPCMILRLVAAYASSVPDTAWEPRSILGYTRIARYGIMLGAIAVPHIA
eukprot:190579-Rhodomonas_salina.1